MAPVVKSNIFDADLYGEGGLNVAVLNDVAVTNCYRTENEVMENDAEEAAIKLLFAPNTLAEAELITKFKQAFDDCPPSLRKSTKYLDGIRGVPRTLWTMGRSRQLQDCEKMIDAWYNDDAVSIISDMIQACDDQKFR